MNAPAFDKPAATPSALDVFIARAEARAAQWQAGEISLIDAVDLCQRLAEALGLVIALGQDEVQSLIVDVFAPLRTDLQPELIIENGEDSFAAACRAADEKQRRKPPDLRMERLRELMADDVSLERASAEMHAERRRGAAAESTVHALMFSLRERGVKALVEPTTQRRLAELSSQQIREVIGRLIALRPEYPTVDDELLFLLGEQL